MPGIPGLKTHEQIPLRVGTGRAGRLIRLALPAGGVDSSAVGLLSQEYFIDPFSSFPIGRSDCRSISVFDVSVLLSLGWLVCHKGWCRVQESPHRVLLYRLPYSRESAEPGSSSTALVVTSVPECGRAWSWSINGLVLVSPGRTRG
jgi:hypothetical protein